MAAGPVNSRVTRRINIALQGGGAHGAFTWGVLDRLLEEEGLEIAGISGTSAGALNGAALKAGLVTGGRQAARDNLDWLWTRMGAVHDDALAPWFRAFWPAPGVMSKLIELAPAYQFADAATRVFSPYGLPFADNPLRAVAERFHYDRVCSRDGPALFVCATNVRSGKVRVFEGDAITPDALLASACLPTLFRAVEIEDAATGRREAYWDGGYTGNPALFPLFRPELPDDLVIVNINPLYRAEVPKSAHDIQNRVNEISFNASLLRELRAIQFVRDLIRDGKVVRGTMKDVLVHMIGDDALMNDLSVATKLVPEPSVLAALKAAGRGAAQDFLDRHWDRLGRESNVDLRAMFG